jgi:hypothetical protein
MGRKGDFLAKKVPFQSKRDLLDSTILVLIKNMNVEKVSFQVKSWFSPRKVGVLA